MVFGHFGDRVGRKKMLVVALMMMGIATFAIGLLPTYATIGVAAPILLLVCRLLQGFAVGGEWGGAVLMAAEHGDDEPRGFWSSWPQAGVPLGNLLATGVLFVLAAFQSDADFEAWGWRIPFLLSAVLVLIGLYVRPPARGVAGLPGGQGRDRREEDRASHMPILEVIKTYPKEVFIAMGMRMAENISYYIFTIVSITYVTTYLDQDKDLILKMLLIAAALQFFLVPAVGALSDKVGRRPLYFDRRRRRGGLGVRLLRPARHQRARPDPAGRRGRAVLPHADVRAAGGVLLRAVRYVGALHRRLGRLPARVDLRRCAGADHRGRAARSATRNTSAVGIYVAIAAVITIVAVLSAKETGSTSLRHDRVVRDAHG